MSTIIVNFSGSEPTQLWILQKSWQLWFQLISYTNKNKRKNSKWIKKINKSEHSPAIIIFTFISHFLHWNVKNFNFGFSTVAVIFLLDALFLFQLSILYLIFSVGFWWRFSWVIFDDFGKFGVMNFNLVGFCFLGLKKLEKNSSIRIIKKKN